MKKIFLITSLLTLLFPSVAFSDVGSIKQETPEQGFCDNTVYYMLPVGDSITYGLVGDDDACSYRDHLQDEQSVGCWGFLGNSSSCNNVGASYDKNYIGGNGWNTTTINSELTTRVPGILPEGADESNAILIYYGGANDWAGCTPNFNTQCSTEDLNALADRIIAGVNIWFASYPNAKAIVIYPTPYGGATTGAMKSVVAFNSIIDARIDAEQLTNPNIFGFNAYQMFLDLGCGTGYTYCFYDYTHPNNIGHGFLGVGVYETITNCENYLYCNGTHN